MKNWQKDRSCSIHSNMHACLQFKPDNLILNTGMALASKWAILSRLCLVCLVIISMESLVVLLGGPVDTHREGLLVDIIKIVEVKVVVIIAVRFHLRGEDHLFILEIVLLQTLPEELVVDMEHLLIIPKVVNTGFLAAGVQIHKVVTEISSTVGSNSIE